MSVEQLVIFIVAFAIAFLQLLGRFLKRQKSRLEPEGAGSEAPEFMEEPSFETPFEAPELVQTPVVTFPAAPAQPPVPSAPPPRPFRPPSAERRALPTAAVRRASVVPRDRSSLRRTMELMAIFGPPRSLDPYRGVGGP